MMISFAGLRMITASDYLLAFYEEKWRQFKLFECLSMKLYNENHGMYITFHSTIFLVLHSIFTFYSVLLQEQVLLT